MPRPLLFEELPALRGNVEWMPLGDYPTPVEKMEGLCRAEGFSDFYVKRDDLSSPHYGGNKVRKLEHIIPAALDRRARRIVTFGAAGSHHVLATALYGVRSGLRVAAILTPQARTRHAVENLRASLAAGLEAHAAPSAAGIALCLASTLTAGDHVVPPGGSSIRGALGYVSAATELAAQIRAGAAPTPDLIVLALGSGGTTAGLLAGLVRERLAAKVLAVRVVHPLLAGKLRTLGLASSVAHRIGARASWTELHAQLEVETGYLGPGYGSPSAAAARATTLASGEGLVLEPTYTAKAFAAALDRVARGGQRCILFWHTFSSAPFEPLLERAPAEEDLPAELRALFTAPGT